MKIIALKPYAIATPVTDWTFVKVETDEPGIFGWGECSLPGKPNGRQQYARNSGWQACAWCLCCCASIHLFRPGDAVHIENLYELACWLSTARLYIGNDSGITHLAAAVGTPVIALFVATDPVIWAPRGEHEAISVAGALDAAANGLDWDAVIAGPGPGIIGSDTEFLGLAVERRKEELGPLGPCCLDDRLERVRAQSHSSE